MIDQFKDTAETATRNIQISTAEGTLEYFVDQMALKHRGKPAHDQCETGAANWYKELLRVRDNRHVSVAIAMEMARELLKLRLDSSE